MSKVQVSPKFIKAVTELVKALEEDFGKSDDSSESLDFVRGSNTTYGHVQLVSDMLDALKNQG